MFCCGQTVTGYRRDGCKTFLFYVLVVLTLGILLLVLYWKKELDCLLKRKECPLYSADVVLVKVSGGVEEVGEGGEMGWQGWGGGGERRSWTVC